MRADKIKLRPLLGFTSITSREEFRIEPQNRWRRWAATAGVFLQRAPFAAARSIGSDLLGRRSHAREDRLWHYN